VKIEDPATLRTHTDEDPRVDLATPAQLDASLANMRRRQLDRLAPGTASAPWEASRGLLRRILEVRSTIEQPTPFELDVKPTKRFKINDFAISHALIGRKGTGEQIPVVLIEPTKPNGRLTVYVSERGKGGLIDSRGELAPLVSELLALGHSVVGFDPLFTCESLDPTRPTTRRPSADHYDTYNRTLAADRLQDLAAVVAWAGTLRGVDQVNLAGDGEGAVLALLARPVIEGVARTSVDLAGFDYGDGSSAVSPGIDLPGVLQFGGLPVAAALSAPDPLWISRAGVTFDMKWPMKSYAIADSRAQLRIDDAAPDPKTRAAWLDDGTVPEASKP
jgi:hypothetical protein